VRSESCDANPLQSFSRNRLHTVRLPFLARQPDCFPFQRAGLLVRLLPFAQPAQREMFSGLQPEFYVKLLTWGARLGGLQFEHPGTVSQLVFLMQLRIVAGAGLPHFPKDFSASADERHRKAQAWDLPRLRRVW
jgi:hypothetical protein